jgi:NAD(P)H dehydrogenase (quinone)
MYIVTGVDGHFGGSVAELMLSSVPGDQLIFTTPFPDRIPAARVERWKDSGVQVRQGDYDHPDELVEAFRGGDRLFMLSAMKVGPVRQQEHRNAISAAVKAGVKFVVYTSYIGAEKDNAEAIVTVDHHITEGLIKESGLEWNVMRDSMYMQTMAEQQASVGFQTGNWRVNERDGRIGYVSRDDCIRVATALLLGKGQPNTAYNITGSEALSYPDVFRMITELSGRDDVKYLEVTDDALYEFWDALGVPREATGDFSNSPTPWCSDDMVSYGRCVRQGDMDVVTSDVELLTGRKPIRLAEVLAEASRSWPKPELVSA